MKNNSVSKSPNGHMILKRKKKTQRTNKYMEKYSLTFAIMELQIKTTGTLSHLYHN